MGDVAYRDREYWTKGGASDAASAAWADANRTDMRLILAAWYEANTAARNGDDKTAWNQFSKALSDLHAAHQQLRLELTSLRAQLATQEMHKAVAEYGYLMRRERTEVLEVRNFIRHVQVRVLPLRTKRDVFVYNQTQRGRRQHELADQLDGVDYSGVRALRPFRYAAGAAFLGALSSGLTFGWLGNRQTVELVGAAVGLVAYLIAHFASANANSKSYN